MLYFTAQLNAGEAAQSPKSPIEEEEGCQWEIGLWYWYMSFMPISVRHRQQSDRPFSESPCETGVYHILKVLTAM